MGQTSAKVAPEMEDKNEDGQNSIQTAAICEAEDARDGAEANATSASRRSRRSAEETHPAGARALRFDHRCAQWQAQRGVCVGGHEGNRMRDKLPRIRFNH